MRKLLLMIAVAALASCSSDPAARARFLDNLGRLGAGMQIDRQSPDVPPAPAATVHGCFKSREWISGTLKNCAYKCLEGETVRTISSVELCPLTIE